MLVELEKVIKIVKDHFTNGNDIKEVLIDKLELKLYECINCGKNIYFDMKDNYYRHVEQDSIRCDHGKCLESMNILAMPSPENFTSKEAWIPVDNIGIHKLARGKVIIDYNEELFLINGESIAELIKEFGLDRHDVEFFYIDHGLIYNEIHKT